MKANENLNIKAGSWNGVKHHTERTYQDPKRSMRNVDKNLNINPRLSPLNRSSDGQLIAVRVSNQDIKKYAESAIYHKHGKAYVNIWKPSKRGYSRIEHREAADAKKLFSTGGWLTKHNRQAKTHHNYRRIIKDPKRELKRHARTAVITFGDSDLNNECIGLIQHSIGRGRKDASRRFLRAMSEAHAEIAKDWNNRYHHLKMGHWSTNVDEAQDHGDTLDKYGHAKLSALTDANHLHAEIYGLAWSKVDSDWKPVTKSKAFKKKNGKIGHHRAGKPSFNFTKAVEQEFHVKNRRKALKKFRDVEDRRNLKIIQHVLTERFPYVQQFQKLTLSRTHSKHTGRTMSQVKRQHRIDDKLQAERARIGRMNRTRKLRWRRQKNLDSGNRERAYQSARSNLSSASSKTSSYLMYAINYNIFASSFSNKATSASSQVVSYSSQAASYSTQATAYSSAIIDYRKEADAEHDKMLEADMNLQDLNGSVRSVKQDGLNASASASSASATNSAVLSFGNQQVSTLNESLNGLNDTLAARERQLDDQPTPMTVNGLAKRLNAPERVFSWQYWGATPSLLENDKHQPLLKTTESDRRMSRYDTRAKADKCQIHYGHPFKAKVLTEEFRENVISRVKARIRTQTHKFYVDMDKFIVKSNQAFHEVGKKLHDAIPKTWRSEHADEIHLTDSAKHLARRFDVAARTAKNHLHTQLSPEPLDVADVNNVMKHLTPMGRQVLQFNERIRAYGLPKAETNGFQIALATRYPVNKHDRSVIGKRLAYVKSTVPKRYQRLNQNQLYKKELLTYGGIHNFKLGDFANFGAFSQASHDENEWLNEHRQQPLATDSLGSFGKSHGDDVNPRIAFIAKDVSTAKMITKGSPTYQKQVQQEQREDARSSQQIKASIHATTVRNARQLQQNIQKNAPSSSGPQLS